MSSDDIGEPGSPWHGERLPSRLPSLVALRCFEAAAQLENFSRAADALHLTHGAVSRAVRLLEDELGVALFERRNRRAFRTEDGRTLARAVHEGLGLVRQATHALRQRARQPRVQVLSCEPTLLMRWRIPRWPDFQPATRARNCTWSQAADRSRSTAASTS
jgi:DNA-binding transcriptional LysR family regulator